MCGVEGAEYGFTRIFVGRGTIVTGARFRCRTRLGLAARPAVCARRCDIYGRGPSQRVPAGRRGRGGEPLDLAI
jgi:hypothetical protein